MNENQQIYSYSKLTTFLQCEKQYYYNYILKKQSKDNIYNLLGTSFHDCAEKMQQGEMTNDEAEERFLEDYEEMQIFGYDFMSEKVEKNYIESIKHYLQNFEKIDEEYEIEKEFIADFDGYKVKGFIDMVIYHDNNEVSIYDFKTSSMYNKKAIEEHSMQLLIYAYGMIQQGYKIRDVQWDMAKYAKVKSKRGYKNVLRSELETNEFERCFIQYPVNDYTLMNCKEWVIDTIKQIESRTEQFEQWKTNSDSSFFCQNLCGFCKECPKAKQLKNDFLNKG